MGYFWALVDSLIPLPQPELDQITHHILPSVAFSCPPKKKTVIELAEGKIGFFGYRNRTKLQRELGGGLSDAFFLLLNVNDEHSYCVLPPQTP